MSPIKTALIAARDAFARRAHHHFDPNQHRKSVLHGVQHCENVMLWEKMQAAIEYVEKKTMYYEYGVDEPETFVDAEGIAGHLSVSYMGSNDGETEVFDVGVYISLSPRKMEVTLYEGDDGEIYHRWRWIENQEQS